MKDARSPSRRGSDTKPATAGVTKPLIDRSSIHTEQARDQTRKQETGMPSTLSGEVAGKDAAGNPTP
jgi:hypothetical protein